MVNWGFWIDCCDLPICRYLPNAGWFRVFLVPSTGYFHRIIHHKSLSNKPASPPLGETGINSSGGKSWASQGHFGRRSQWSWFPVFRHLMKNQKAHSKKKKQPPNVGPIRANQPLPQEIASQQMRFLGPSALSTCLISWNGDVCFGMWFGDWMTEAGAQWPKFFFFCFFFVLNELQMLWGHCKPLCL